MLATRIKSVKKYTVYIVNSKSMSIYKHVMFSRLAGQPFIYSFVFLFCFIFYFIMPNLQPLELHFQRFGLPVKLNEGVKLFCIYYYFEQTFKFNEYLWLKQHKLGEALMRKEKKWSQVHHFLQKYFTLFSVEVYKRCILYFMVTFIF